MSTKDLLCIIATIVIFISVIWYTRDITTHKETGGGRYF